MKKSLLILAFLTISFYGFAQEETESTEEKPTQEVANKLSYYRLGVGMRDENDDPGIVIGAGKRHEISGGAIDVSMNYCFSQANSSRGGYSYTFPKIMYLKYFTPDSSSSIYGGIGLGFGGIVDKGKKTTNKFESDDIVYMHISHLHSKYFHGLMGNLSLGLEFNRKSIFRNFIQLDMNDPLIAAWQKGSTPKPAFELSFGVAY